MSETSTTPRAPSTHWRDLVALVKPRILLMVLVTSAAGLFLAPGPHEPLRILASLLGTTLIVSAANTLNCWLERDVDKHMTRTQRRPLPAGRLSPDIALYLGFGLAFLSLPLLYVFVNTTTAFLAAVAWVSYVWIYTPLKQKSTLALLVGAVPGAMPPLMGWTSATGGLEAPGLVLFGILFLWQLPHFLAISVFRESEYTRAGIKVVPALFGVRMTKLQAIGYAGALLPVSLLFVPLGIAGQLYLAIAGLAGVVYFGLCVQGLASHDEASDHRWARKVFFASLLYIPLVFAALAIDVAHG